LDRFAITDAILLLGDKLSCKTGLSLIISSGKVAGITDGDLPSDLDRISLPHHLLVPRFVNAHTHIDDSIIKDVGLGMDAWDLVMPPAGMRHKAMEASSREAIREAMRETMEFMMMSGTGAFADFRSQGRTGCEDLRKAAEGLPIKPVIFGRLTIPSGYSERDFVETGKGLTPEQRQELDELLEVAEGFSLVSALDFTDGALAEIRSVVRDRGKLLALHAAEHPRYREISIRRTGVSDVTRILRHLEPDFVVHLTDANEAELDAIADASLPVVLCHRMHSICGYGVPPLLSLLQRQSSVSLGTDNVFLTSPNMLSEGAYVSRLWRGITSDAGAISHDEILAMMTLNGASALKLSDGIGSLAVGKDASFIVFDLATKNLSGTKDPKAALINRAETSDIAAVVARGIEVVGRIGNSQRTPIV